MPTCSVCSAACDSCPSNLDCKHPLSVCPEHASKIIQDRARSGSANYQCPVAGCGRAIKGAAAKWIDQQDESYIVLCVDQISKSQVGYTKCPLSGCPGAHYHIVQSNTPIAACQTCGSHYCFHDRVVWGDTSNHDCSTYGNNKSQTPGPDLKPCPNCKTLIHRISGCNSMYCPICNTHYCYDCLYRWEVSGVHRSFYCPYPKRNTL